MKQFEAPELDVQKIDVEDVITASTGGEGGDEELPPDEF